MKTVLSLLCVSCVAAFTSIASAEPIYDVPPPRVRYVGVQFDVGAPDGAALGLDVRPGVKWLHLNLSGTHNILAPGIRAGFTLDPINYGIAPTLTFELGHSFSGSIPTKSTQVDYSYVNLQPGISFGKREGAVRLFIRGGATWLSGNVTNLNSDVNSDNFSVGDVSFKARFVPSAKFGLNINF